MGEDDVNCLNSNNEFKTPRNNYKSGEYQFNGLISTEFNVNKLSDCS
jgi:hypothetical protein